MNTQYFNTNEIKTFQDLKIQYRELIKQYHPDINANGLEAMKVINSEYEFLFKNIDNMFSSEYKKENKIFDTLDDGYREVITKIININDITIELIGSWIWVSGRGTLNNIGLFKELKFSWSKTKKAWYFNGMDNTKRHYKGRYNMQQLRERHGSCTIEHEKQKMLVAC